MKFANFTPQISSYSGLASDVREWCSVPHDWDHLLLPSGYTIKQEIALNKSLQAQQAGGRQLISEEEELLQEELEKARTSESAPLPGTFFEYETTLQWVDTRQEAANISFYRPFEAESVYQLDIDRNFSYMLVLNWGIFADGSDTSKQYIYGAKTLEDAHEWELLEPTLALSLSCGLVAATTALLL